MIKKKKKDKGKETFREVRSRQLEIQGKMQTERTKRFQAETKLKELKISQIEGNTHATSQCVTEQYQREMRIKKAFMTLGREIASQLVGKGLIEIESIVTERACEIMREIAIKKIN